LSTLATAVSELWCFWRVVSSCANGTCCLFAVPHWRDCDRTGYHGSWASAQRFDPENPWSPFVWKDRWWSGETVATYPLLYTNWADNEPNDWGRNESCLSIVTGVDNKWNDLNCHQSLCFVCDTQRKPTFPSNASK